MELLESPKKGCTEMKELRKTYAISYGFMGVENEF